MIHVLPINDSEPHYFDTTCPCGVEIEYHDQMLVKHQAFDGRGDEKGPKNGGWVVLTDEDLANRA